MATKVPFVLQCRRGTSTQIPAFTPAQGEIVADMTYLREVVGDGVTAGGWPVGKAALKTFGDASTYSVGSGDVILVQISLTTTSTNNYLLPPANTYPVGQELRIQNGTTVVGAITIKASTTPNADSINSTTVISFTTGAAGRSLYTNGSTGWIAVGVGT